MRPIFEYAFSNSVITHDMTIIIIIVIIIIIIIVVVVVVIIIISHQSHISSLTHLSTHGNAWQTIICEAFF